MLTTRLWMGSVLIGLVAGMLLFDRRFDLYPIQMAFQIALAIVASIELIRLLGPSRAPIVPLCYLGVVSLTLFNWVFRGVKQYRPALDFGSEFDPNARFWAYLLGLAVSFQLIVFLWEMAKFREPGQSIERMARTSFVIAYLGLLPSFFAQLRWLYPGGSALGTTALALAIFVPKGCDIGAYFTGRLIGKHPMTPVLSPKKTWEGAIGGLVFATLVAIGIDRFGPAAVLRENLGLEIAFGLSVGLAGMLGDLAESLIKRDCQQKDASQTVPGFGGVLDVVDAVIFAAPVAYVWLLILQH
jgi:phosphatidate cytidylyltransferase